MVDSNHRCPQILKDVFSDLRETTSQFYPGKRMDPAMRICVRNQSATGELFRSTGSATSSPEQFYCPKVLFCGHNESQAFRVETGKFGKALMFHKFHKSGCLKTDGR